jgi:hypothetical protein
LALKLDGKTIDVDDKAWLALAHACETMAGACAAIAVADETDGPTLDANAVAISTAAATSTDVAFDVTRASRVDRVSRVARASRDDTACEARTDGIAIARRRAVTILDVLFIGKKSSGAARETGGNGRANAGEHLLTSDRAVYHGAILRRGIGVE